MINFNRVWAMVYRYTLDLIHRYDRLTDMFYWPFLDLVLWGLTGLFFIQSSNNPHTLTIMITGLIFWLVVWRAQYEITVNLLTEIWDKNIVNIFVSPLTLWEWIISLMICGLTRTILSVTFSGVAAFLLYQYNIFVYGLWLIPIVLSLMLTGWAAGFLVSGLLIKYGVKLQTLAWTGVAMLAPFTAPYFPVSILPDWAQKISIFIPATYIFEGMRNLLQSGNFPLDKLIMSFSLNIFYLIISISVFIFMFNKSRGAGLGRLI